MSGSVQYFKVIRAPECSPLSPAELRRFIYWNRPNSKWEVWDAGNLADRIAELEEDKETLQSVIDSMQSDLTQLRTENTLLNRVINKIKGLNLSCPNDKQIRCVDDDCSECVVRWSRAQAEREIKDGK